MCSMPTGSRKVASCLECTEPMVHSLAVNREKGIAMKVWIGIKEGDKVVHQWVGEVSEKGDMGRATKEMIDDYVRKTGNEMFEKTLSYDKFDPKRHTA